jgi:hypothetical protein
MLFRPMLAQLMSQVENHGFKDLDADEISVEQSVIVRSAILCIMSAQEVISLIFEELSQNAKLVPTSYTYICTSLIRVPH